MLKDKLKKYSQLIIKIALFIAASAIVIYMLPRLGKFKFEFAKGRPWKHGVMISDFDFPIYKTNEQLKIERDSALKYFRPYFYKDTSIVSQEIQEFDTDFPTIFSEIRKDFPFLRNASRYKGKLLSTSFKEFLEQRLFALYKTGIIALPEEESNPPSTFEFKVVSGNMAEPYGLWEVYTSRTAYIKLSDEIRQFLTDSLNSSHNPSSFEVSSLTSQLQLNKYIRSNILFDSNRSETEKQNLLKNISLTSGAIKSGQRIIDKGEMVDDKLMQILTSYKLSFENKIGSSMAYTQILIGQMLIVLSFFTGVFLFLYFFRHDVYLNNKSVSFILLLMVSMIFLARLSSSFFYIPVFVIPFALLPIAIRTFFDSRLALFIHLITILLASFFAQNSFQFVFLQIPVGITAIFSLFNMARRSQLIRASFFIFIIYSILYTALFLWQEGDILKIDLFVYGKFALNGGLLLLTYPAIYVFEKVFGFLSDVTLVELSDTNHPLLRKLAEKSPGTFQHSIQVGNLAQEAAYAIGANPMLVRAGAMYHDIGKMEAPLLFTENQVSGFNPLNEIDYEQAAILIISHIENGIKLAKRHQLPVQIIDFIATHQGTTRTKYFYNSYINKYPDRVPNIVSFSYPGPTPFTKETAILMMADSVEAASRSLSNFSDEEIDKLVESIIDDQIQQKQFDLAPITFKEISEIKSVFKRRIKIIYHARIKYPDIKK